MCSAPSCALYREPYYCGRESRSPRNFGELYTETNETRYSLSSRAPIFSTCCAQTSVLVRAATLSSLNGAITPIARDAHFVALRGRIDRRAGDWLAHPYRTTVLPQ